MIRVLNIVESITFGGVERRRLSMAKLLDKNEFELKIACTHHRGGIAHSIENNGVEVIPVGKLKSMFDWERHRKIQKIIDEFKPHIIHGAVFEGVTMAAINGYLKRVPIVIIEETSDPKNRSWRGNLLMKFFAAISDAIVAVSPSTLHYLRAEINLPERKTVLINNGVAIPENVSPEEIKEIKSQFGIADGDFVVGSIGRLYSDSTKRYSDLIKAFAKFSEGKENTKLVIVGDGIERENYQALAKELGIEDKVIFPGYRLDVAKFYSVFDIFSLVSAHESFGLVLVEAMLHKLPVIATRVGGMQYIVEDGHTGFLVEKYDWNAIADKLEMLYSQSELAVSMGQKGYQRAMENYTENRYVAEVSDLYKRLAKAKNII